MTKQEALGLFDTHWWKNRTAHEIVQFQLFEPLLCMPFDEFHKAVEEALGRSVWTHEFGLNHDGLKAEFLGDSAPPTMQEIIDLIPEAKRIVVVVSGGNK